VYKHIDKRINCLLLLLFNIEIYKREIRMNSSSEKNLVAIARYNVEYFIMDNESAKKITTTKV
jgi:hypothetical protein